MKIHVIGPWGSTWTDAVVSVLVREGHLCTRLSHEMITWGGRRSLFDYLAQIIDPSQNVHAIIQMTEMVEQTGATISSAYQILVRRYYNNVVSGFGSDCADLDDLIRRLLWDLDEQSRRATVLANAALSDVPNVGGPLILGW